MCYYITEYPHQTISDDREISIRSDHHHIIQSHIYITEIIFNHHLRAYARIKMELKIVALSVVVLMLHLINSNPVVHLDFETEKGFNPLGFVSKMMQTSNEDRERREVGALRSGLKCNLKWPYPPNLPSFQVCDEGGGADYCFNITDYEGTARACATRHILDSMKDLEIHLTSAGCKTEKEDYGYTFEVCLCRGNYCN